MQRRKSALKEDCDEVSQFIWCVRRRPTLYNYKLSPQERRRVDVARGWQEVADEFGGKLTPEECRKKWKNLRDTYHQYRLRKSKFKDCLDKWRYSKDLAFLADIYQPKLKSERCKYIRERSSSNIVNFEDGIRTILIDSEGRDDSTSQDIKEDILIDDDYGETVEEVEMDSVQFCDMETVDEMNNMKGPDEIYGEVCLYEEGENNVIAINDLEEAHKIKLDSSENYVQEQHSDRVHLTIGNDSDELDLFFQFLKTKIQKLPPVEITAIQIEFLNAVLKREAHNSACS